VDALEGTLDLEECCLNLKWETTVNLLIGIVLLIIGLGMVFIARPNKYGNRRIPLTDSVVVVYPAICLAFLAFGLAIIFAT
jgi:hypothetical protein